MPLAFRDERDAMRAHLDALEDEVERLRDENERLRRQGARPAGAFLLGAPTRLRAERAVEAELEESAHEHLVEALRARFGALGRVGRLGRSLAWSLGPPSSARVVEVSVSTRGGRTQVRVAEQVAQLAGGMFGGIVGGVGGGGLGFVIPTLALLRMPTLIPFAAVAWLLVVFTAVRAAFAGITRARTAELEACADELAAIVMEGAPGGGAQVRVAAGEAPDGAALDASDERDAAQPHPPSRGRTPR